MVIIMKRKEFKNLRSFFPSLNECAQVLSVLISPPCMTKLDCRYFTKSTFEYKFCSYVTTKKKKGNEIKDPRSFFFDKSNVFGFFFFYFFISDL